MRLREIYETCFQEDLASNATAAANATATATAARRLLEDSDATNATAAVYETDPEFGTPEQQDAVAAFDGTCGPFDAFCYACYCLEHIDATSVYREASYCEPYVYGFTLQIVARSASQGIIFVLNVLLNPLLAFLVKYERHHSNSGEQRSLMVKLFLAQFFNSSINLLIIAGAFPELKAYFKGTVAEGVLFEGEIADSTRTGTPTSARRSSSPSSRRRSARGSARWFASSPTASSGGSPCPPP